MKTAKMQLNMYKCVEDAMQFKTRAFSTLLKKLKIGSYCNNLLLDQWRQVSAMNRNK